MYVVGPVDISPAGPVERPPPGPLPITPYRSDPESELELWCHARISWMYARPISGKPRKSDDSLGKSHLSSVRLATLRRAANSSRVIPSGSLPPAESPAGAAG